jgi:molybdopterin molybdotransferase
MEPDASNLMTVDEAITVIDRLPVRPRRIQVPITEAIGLRLAQDLIADRDYPPLDKSLMDGYAVRAAGASELLVVGESAAGAIPSRGIGPGEAMTVMTGAAIPPGADAVVPIEQTGSIRIRPGRPEHFASCNPPRREPSSPGGRRRAPGTVLLTAGTMLRRRTDSPWRRVPERRCVTAWDKPALRRAGDGK